MVSKLLYLFHAHAGNIMTFDILPVNPVVLQVIYAKRFRIKPLML